MADSGEYNAFEQWLDSLPALTPDRDYIAEAREHAANGQLPALRPVTVRQDERRVLGWMLLAVAAGVALRRWVG